MAKPKEGGYGVIVTGDNLDIEHMQGIKNANNT
jgi:hypothetical protein